MKNIILLLFTLISTFIPIKAQYSLRLIDPTGMDFTDRAWAEIGKFVKDYNKKYYNNNLGNDLIDFRSVSYINSYGVSPIDLSNLQNLLDMHFELME